MLDHLLDLSPSGFEHAVAQLLPHLGCDDAHVMGGSGDLGVDIQCRDAHGGLVAVQCKRFLPGHNITSPNIQQFFGMLVHHGARTGIYVTTSGFTRQARELADARDIRIIDGMELAALFAANPGALGFEVETGAVQNEAPRDDPWIESLGEEAKAAREAEVEAAHRPSAQVPVNSVQAQEPIPRETVIAAQRTTRRWGCLGCCRHVPATLRTCPNCLYTLSPRLWKNVNV